MPTVAVFALFALVAAGCGEVAPAKGWAGPVALSGTASSGGGGESVVVIQSQPGRLQALALGGTGAPAGERWRFPANDDDPNLRAIYASPLLLDGRLVVTAFSGHILALDPASGRPIPGWGAEIDGRIIANPVLDASGDRLFVATDHGRVYPVDVDSGSVGAPLTTRDVRVYGAAGRLGDELYFGSLDRRLFALRLSNGAGVAWDVEAPPIVGDMRALDSTLYVGTLEAQVRAYDAATGAVRWSFDAASWLWAAPLVTSDTVYAADLDGRVYALDRDGGRERWRTTALRGEVRATPVLTQGALVLATGEGAIFAIDPGSGAELWVAEPEAGALLANPLVLESSILYVTDAGTLLRITPASGAVETVYKRS